MPTNIGQSHECGRQACLTLVLTSFVLRMTLHSKMRHSRSNNKKKEAFLDLLFFHCPVYCVFKHKKKHILCKYSLEICIKLGIFRSSVMLHQKCAYCKTTENAAYCDRFWNRAFIFVLLNV